VSKKNTVEKRLNDFSLASANPHAKKLYEDLLSEYNRLIRPVSNNSDKLTVKLGLKLSQLMDVVRIIQPTEFCTN